MCEADAVDRLLALNFVSFSEDVEAALSFKSRNADPLSRPLYSNVLYSWYIYRGDFRSGTSFGSHAEAEFLSYFSCFDNVLARTEVV